MKASQRYSVAFLLAIAFALPAAAGDDFKPVPPDELKLKDNPAHPGDHAMYLEYRSEQDDNQFYESVYVRMKIFSEEGKKYGDIEIPYLKGFEDISDLKARTVQPDGTVVPYTGKPYDKLIVKNRFFRYQAKTFGMPDIRPGSIIEYRFRRNWERSLRDTAWILQEDLFIKKLGFKLKTYSGEYGSYWIAIGLPSNKKVERKGNDILLELENIAPFDEEKYSPPERELKPRVLFYYTTETEENPDRFWAKVGKEQQKAVEDFLGHRKGAEQTVANLVAPGDSPEAKLHKIYAHVQAMRNLSYERDKSEQEAKRDKLKNINNADDVVRQGYGWRSDLNRLFVAMVRAAGMEAWVVKVSERDDHFFMKNLMDRRQLDSEVAFVRAGGKEYYFDVGVPYCPFGKLGWQRTGVQALLLGNKDDVRWITTPIAQPEDALTRHQVKLEMTESGVKAEIAISYFGLEALHRRLVALDEDDVEVRKEYEDEVKSALPTGSTVKLRNIVNLKAPGDQPLVVEFEADLPDFYASVGSRKLLPMAVMNFDDRGVFTHAQRVHPVYFSYPYEEEDVISLAVPPDMKIDTLPTGRRFEPQVGGYVTSFEKAKDAVVMKRAFAIYGIFFKQEFYGQLRSFYQNVAMGDQDNVVLTSAAAAAK